MTVFLLNNFGMLQKALWEKNCDCSIPTLIHNDEHITSNKMKVECFNQSFVNKSFLNESHASLTPKANKTTYSLSTIILTESLVRDILQSLEPCKASGPDGIGPRLIKEAGVVIASSLT